MKFQRIPIETLRTLKFAAYFTTEEFCERCMDFNQDEAEIRRIGAIAEKLSLDTFEQLQAIGVTNLEIKEIS